MNPESEQVKKDGAGSALGESLFGIRWAKTGRVKIVWGVVFLFLCAVIILDPNLRDESVLLLILFVGGIWLIYRGVKQKNIKK